MSRDNLTAVRPDPNEVLNRLKAFQRRTAEYVFRRMYTDDDPTRRFLVADEAGLGKTMVARGVIAQALDYMWDKVDRLDVIYICSNADIARQNIARLVPTGNKNVAMSTRITMLPARIGKLDSKLNFISLTPGTSFDLRSSLGTKNERAVLYWMLHDAWSFGSKAPPMYVLQGNAGPESFRECLEEDKTERQTWNESIDPDLRDRFLGRLKQDIDEKKKAGKADLRSRFEKLCGAFSRSNSRVNKTTYEERAQMVGELRGLVATACLQALKPDLIILDEFQRFRSLLHRDSEAGRLASDLFSYQESEFEKARILLLSATPYKTFTRHHETEEDHHKDFIETLKFLYENNDEKIATLRGALQAYRTEMYRLGEVEPTRALELKAQIERDLCKVIARTERLAVTENRDGMLVQVQETSAHLAENDLLAYLELQGVAREIGTRDTLEYWKSAPYLLNFMDDYAVKRDFIDALQGEQSGDLVRSVRQSKHSLIDWGLFERYGKIDPANARLRGLMADTVDRGAWQLLWLPPSLPYYSLEGPLGESGLRGFTKRLVFSSWRVVPKAVASLLSYAVERQMIRAIEKKPRNTSTARKARRSRRPLQFSRTTKLDRRSLRGMAALSLLYPCITLAREADPRRYTPVGGLGSLKKLRREMAVRIRPLLKRVGAHWGGKGAEDASWYWAAPVLLDLKLAGEKARPWLERDNLAQLWRGEGLATDAESSIEADTETAWSDHIAELKQLVAGNCDLGRAPDDLVDVMIDVALGAPGVTLLRALTRMHPEMRFEDETLRDEAAYTGRAFLRLFNLPETVALLRKCTGADPYWRRVLGYGAEGCLQAVLDEYTHVLRESLGLIDAQPKQTIKAVAEAIRNSVGLRTSVPQADRFEASTDGREILRSQMPMRCHFAQRFGDEETEDGGGPTRADQVRAAFNSPFWPFVLATTSVGQEGLDFHTYCHRVVHWNLPSNPVDLEQREGRIHRYKGHAVRKNLAADHGKAALAATEEDPWAVLFEFGRPKDPGPIPGLVPYWIYPGEAKIEREVPALPMSRDLERLDTLRRELAVYRMVFGQPRQDDLLEFLLERTDAVSLRSLATELTINLTPN